MRDCKFDFANLFRPHLNVCGVVFSCLILCLWKMLLTSLDT